MRAAHCVCDRCYQLIAEPVVLHCLTHCLRKTAPRSQLDLCPECVTELIAWVKAGPAMAGGGDE